MGAEPSAACISRTLIDRTLASGIRLLRFPAPLERYFEAETGPERCRRFIARGLMALVLYDLFLIADWQITPDVFPIALVLRLAVVTPLSLLLIMMLRRQPPVWLRETIGTLAVVLACGSTFGLMLLSDAPYRVTQHHAIILVVLFATIVQRVRFPYAVVGCLLCLAFQAGALALVADYPHELWASTNLLLGGAIVLSLAAAYTLERDARLAYLTGLRERLLNDELAALSLHDPLTGLSNRRSLDETLARMELVAGDAATTETAILLFDVDHFKLYNDSVGHQAGDVCLKRIAGLLQAELRDLGDLAFRFGGEEFLVVLPRTSLSMALAVAERVRRAVEEAAIPHPALLGTGVVTVSAGAAATMLGQGLRAAEIIAGADAALYAAKRNGRNQVWPPFLAARRPEVVALPERRSRTS